MTSALKLWHPQVWFWHSSLGHYCLLQKSEERYSISKLLQLTIVSIKKILEMKLYDKSQETD